MSFENQKQQREATARATGQRWCPSHLAYVPLDNIRQYLDTRGRKIWRCDGCHAARTAALKGRRT